MRARWIAAAAVAVGIAGAGIVAHPGEPAPAAECTRTALPGEWRCTFPTSARTAVVYVSAWEDGSARAIEVDPDSPYQEVTP